MNRFKIFSFMLILSMVSAITIAQGAITRQFKDWRARCDDSGDCKALATDVSTTGSAARYQLEISRQQGRGKYWVLTFFITGDKARTYEPLHVSVDFNQPLTLEPDTDYQPGAQASAYDIIGVFRANTLMKQFARGNESFFNFLNSKGQETVARFSLRGLSAALLWIDDTQNRLGSPRTIGAVKSAIAKENKPADNIFTSGDTRILAPGKIPPAIAKLHFADGECDAIDRPPLSAFGFETVTIDKNKKLYLIPCFAAAYNVVYRIYLNSSNQDRPRQLLFADYSSDLGWSGTRDIMNITYDAETKTLSSFYKGRGLGDCGSTSIYRWKKYAFKMVEYRYWGKCDGTRQSQDWPIIYPIPKL